MIIIVTHAVAFLAGGIAVYLILRNNPSWKAKVDAVADRVDKR